MARNEMERKAHKMALIALVSGGTGLLWIMRQAAHPGTLPILLFLLAPVFWSLACGMLAQARGRNRTLWTLLGGSYELFAFMFLASRPKRPGEAEEEKPARGLPHYKHKLK